MHTILTRRMLRDTVDPDTGKMTSTDRETVMPILLATGVAVVVLMSLSGCKQLNGNMTDASVSRPVAVVQAATDAHDNRWISQAHALAAKNGADGAVSDLSY
jgi:hypothetical protein